MNASITVRDNTESRSYDAVLGDRVVGLIPYERRGNRAIFQHTVVEPEFRGQGIATTLVRAALDDLMANGNSLTNYCGFITDFIARHPDYARVLDTGNPDRPRPYDSRS
jgi:uncharacterized protein